METFSCLTSSHYIQNLYHKMNIHYTTMMDMIAEIFRHYASNRDVSDSDGNLDISVTYNERGSKRWCQSLGIVVERGEKKQEGNRYQKQVLKYLLLRYVQSGNSWSKIYKWYLNQPRLENFCYYFQTTS